MPRYHRWLRVGPHVFNKNFIVRSLEKDGTETTADLPEGGVRVVCLPGDAIVLVGAEAEIFRREMLEEAPIRAYVPDPHRAASAGGSLSLDPRTEPGPGLEGGPAAGDPGG